MWKRVILAVTILSVVAPGIAADQGRSQGRGSGSSGSSEKKGDGSDPNVSVNFTFNSGDRDTFRNYFRTNNITAEPLPPGIAKNLARGKALPPGIAKKAFPNDLVRGLGSRVRPGITFTIAGDRVVALKDGKVVDIIEGLFR
jgi:hypothetical protein